MPSYAEPFTEKSKRITLIALPIKLNQPTVTTEYSVSVMFTSSTSRDYAKATQYKKLVSDAKALFAKLFAMPGMLYYTYVFRSQ